MKAVIIVVACLFSLIGFGQTKLISFRSHSGNNANFRTAVENNLFDIPNSNFGIISPSEKIDSVIKESNDRIIVLKRKYYPGNNSYNYFLQDTLTRANASDFFAANNMQSLKEAIQKKYKTAVQDSILFIGFGKKFKNKKDSPKK